MTNRSVQLQLGIVAIVAALFLIFVLIPYRVSSPSNVSNIILSPVFWPYTLAGFTLLTGLGMVGTTLLSTHHDPTPLNDPIDDSQAAWLRLAGVAVLMIVTMFALPRLGMVGTTMLAFAALAFLIRTRHPRTALICAVVIPLVLYLFFAHVAGVAIPQGDYVRLP